MNIRGNVFSLCIFKLVIVNISNSEYLIISSMYEHGHPMTQIEVSIVCTERLVYT